MKTLTSAMPATATSDGRQIYVTDPDGLVIATAPRNTDLEGMPLIRILGESQPLTIFGERAGVLEIKLADGTSALATVHFTWRAGAGSIAIVESTGNVYGDWRADVPSTSPSSSAPAPSCW